ncbi:hypothetical protein EJ06DRAFT_557702 [Trichodelitschia bisporula]|uniref:PLC-like phosphodiesterase n=1 Tax=Trichodelitschia bisporula TaxID=703511 RepID=A0A6G1HTR9_9PEZI|nr:hypothetical protein EJ06DRAFT_557702 [Trichodelitschia bisporula]
MHFPVLTLALLAQLPSSLASPTAPPKGKRIQWVGHSFHWFLPEPVAQLATEAGIQGHVNIGVDRIGASTPCQHWNKGGNDTNTVKETLKAAKADVLTLATRELPQEECVPKFAQLGFQYKKDLRVMVHETWLPQSAAKDAEGCADWGCTNRDAATIDVLEDTRNKLEIPYKNKLRAQLQRLNAQAGTNLTSIVPVWDAVISMREMVVKGQLPGVPKQSSLFMDKLGHAQKPLRDMASYMWFAALYNINPIGSKVLTTGTPAGQAAILQKLAWETLKKEPLNGIGL